MLGTSLLMIQNLRRAALPWYPIDEMPISAKRSLFLFIFSIGAQVTGVVLVVNFLKYNLGTFTGGLIIGSFGNILLLIAIINIEVGLYDHRQSDPRERRKLFARKKSYEKHSETQLLLSRDSIV